MYTRKDLKLPPADMEDLKSAALKKILYKYDAKLRRMCQVRASGKAGVTKEILETWKRGGVARHGLVKMLAECKGDKAHGVHVIPPMVL